MSQNILLISDTTLTERTSVHGNIDPKLLYPTIKVAQDMYLQPIIGSVLLSKLQALVATGTVPADYKLLLDNYIADALIYYTLSELPTTLSYQFWNKGVVRHGGDNNETPSESELFNIQNKYRNYAEFYGTRLRDYLLAQRGLFPTKYPEFNQYQYELDTIRPGHNAHTLPVYLGPDRRDNCEYGYDRPENQRILYRT